MAADGVDDENALSRRGRTLFSRAVRFYGASAAKVNSVMGLHSLRSRRSRLRETEGSCHWDADGAQDQNRSAFVKASVPRRGRLSIERKAQSDALHGALGGSLRRVAHTEASKLPPKHQPPCAMQSEKDYERADKILSRSTIRMSESEKRWIWRARMELLPDRRAITKILHAVDFSNAQEVEEVSRYLSQCTSVDIVTALRLLAGDASENQCDVIRRHAIAALDKSSDEELMGYLLQLVQALRYDALNSPEIYGSGAQVPRSSSPRNDDSSYLMDAMLRLGSALGYTEFDVSGDTGNAAFSVDIPVKRSTCLAEFIIRRAIGSLQFATLFHWYLVTQIACDSAHAALFKRVHQAFLASLLEHRTSRGFKIIHDLRRQSRLVAHVFASSENAMKGGGSASKREARLRQALRVSSAALFPTHVPVLPDFKAIRLSSDTAKVFVSATFPASIEFLGISSSGSLASHNTAPLQRCRCIFKSGDDMRQDQLVIQLFRVMDAILRDAGIDNHFVFYNVVPVSDDKGIVEFVGNSSTIRAALRNHGSIAAYLGLSVGGANDADEKRERFIKSAAGWCVATYILGIGDRHLDNIMISKTGELWHLDFGYAFGRDPKPFSQPVRVTCAMIDGMGGRGSPGHEQFKKRCARSFIVLREHSQLILNLLRLMSDSGIHDLSVTQSADEALRATQARFVLECDRADAEAHILSVIDSSAKAIMPRIFDFFHDMNN